MCVSPFWRSQNDHLSNYQHTKKKKIDYFKYFELTANKSSLGMSPKTILFRHSNGHSIWMTFDALLRVSKVTETKYLPKGSKQSLVGQIDGHRNKSMFIFFDNRTGLCIGLSLRFQLNLRAYVSFNGTGLPLPHFHRHYTFGHYYQR